MIVYILVFPNKLNKPKNMFKKQGLYRPEYEHENCGAGFICNLNGEKTNQIIHDALEILIKLKHRGGVSSDGVTGDGVVGDDTKHPLLLVHDPPASRM